MKKEMIYTHSQRKEMASAFADHILKNKWEVSWEFEDAKMEYTSYEAGVMADISVHFIQRCEERSVTSDTFFVALETFFQSTKRTSLNSKKKPLISNVLKGKKFAICSKEAGAAFIVAYNGYDLKKKKIRIAAITALPFKDFDSTYFYADTELFTELVTTETGEHKVKVVPTKKIKFNKNGR